jgi:hypothetical protein
MGLKTIYVTRHGVSNSLIELLCSSNFTASTALPFGVGLMCTVEGLVHDYTCVTLPDDKVISLQKLQESSGNQNKPTVSYC